LRTKGITGENHPVGEEGGKTDPFYILVFRRKKRGLRNVLILLLLTQNRVHNMFRCCKLDYQAITENWALSFCKACQVVMLI
jgi:hypothetical protein